MKITYLPLFVLLLASLETANAGPISPLNVTYLDITLNGFGCSSTTAALPGIHLEINHSNGIVRGRGTGCLNSAADQNLIGSVSNFDKYGTGISILIPGLQQLLIIDDSPKKWVSYFLTPSSPMTGDYFLGAPF